MKLKRSAVAVVIAVGLLSACTMQGLTGQNPDKPNRPTPSADPVKRTLAMMKARPDALALEAAQVLVASGCSTGKLTGLVTRLHIGGIILFDCNLDGSIGSLNQQLHDSGKRNDVHIRPLVSVDLEPGLRPMSGVTTLPHARDLAASFSPKQVEAKARQNALEAHKIGFDVVFSPDADVCLVPRCALDFRSFGTDPGRVSDYVAAAVRGYQSNGTH